MSRRSDAPDRNRHLKMVCPECGYIARASRHWIERVGPTHCPQHGAMRLDLSERLRAGNLTGCDFILLGLEMLTGGGRR